MRGSNGSSTPSRKPSRAARARRRRPATPRSTRRVEAAAAAPRSTSARRPTVPRSRRSARSHRPGGRPGRASSASASTAMRQRGLPLGVGVEVPAVGDHEPLRRRDEGLGRAARRRRAELDHDLRRVAAPIQAASPISACPAASDAPGSLSGRRRARRPRASRASRDQNAASPARSPGHPPITTAPRAPETSDGEPVGFLVGELRGRAGREARASRRSARGGATSGDGVSGSSNGQFTCTGPTGSERVASSASRAA